jgi:phosphonate transport system ATP-binding protein
MKSNKSPTLRIDALSKSFGGKPAVDGVSLTIEGGTFVGVIGRSGAGKSTLLRMINRLVEPSSGCVLFGDIEVTALRGKALNQWRSKAAMVFQQFNLVGRLDVLTNVLMGRLEYSSTLRSLVGMWRQEDKVMALAALEQFEMADVAAQRAGSLSGGQQQRVALARALVQEPELILADEPIASLDPRNTQIVMNALRTMNQQLGITVMCNLHSVEIARAYCDRLIGMNAGRVMFDGPPQQLTQSVIRDLYGFESASVPTNDAQAGPSKPPAHGMTIVDIGSVT